MNTELPQLEIVARSFVAHIGQVDGYSVEVETSGLPGVVCVDYMRETYSIVRLVFMPDYIMVTGRGITGGIVEYEHPDAIDKLTNKITRHLKIFLANPPDDRL